LGHGRSAERGELGARRLVAREKVSARALCETREKLETRVEQRRRDRLVLRERCGVREPRERFVRAEAHVAQRAALLRHG
jgi:hypothetical protein